MTGLFFKKKISHRVDANNRVLRSALWALWEKYYSWRTSPIEFRGKKALGHVEFCYVVYLESVNRWNSCKLKLEDNSKRCDSRNSINSRADQISIHEPASSNRIFLIKEGWFFSLDSLHFHGWILVANNFFYRKPTFPIVFWCFISKVQIHDYAVVKMKWNAAKALQLATSAGDKVSVLLFSLWFNRCCNSWMNNQVDGIFCENLWWNWLNINNDRSTLKFPQRPPKMNCKLIDLLSSFQITTIWPKCDFLKIFQWFARRSSRCTRRCLEKVLGESRFTFYCVPPEGVDRSSYRRTINSFTHQRFSLQPGRQ